MFGRKERNNDDNRARTTQVMNEWEKARVAVDKMRSNELTSALNDLATNRYLKLLASCQLVRLGRLDLLKSFTAGENDTVIAAVSGMAFAACSGEIKALDMLEAVLFDPNPAVKLRVVEDLGMIADGTPGEGYSTDLIRQRAKEMLAKVTSDKDAHVAQLAAQRLEEAKKPQTIISGQTLTYLGRRFASELINVVEGTSKAG
jgi:hypothetical protein